MSEYVVVVRHPDGTEQDITEGVKTLYDHVTTSMDWGSGFLTVEDALEVVNIAKACGFPSYRQAEDQVIQRRGDELFGDWLQSDATTHPQSDDERKWGTHWSYRCPVCNDAKKRLHEQAEQEIRGAAK